MGSNPRKSNQLKPCMIAASSVIVYELPKSYLSSKPHLIALAVILQELLLLLCRIKDTLSG